MSATPQDDPLIGQLFAGRYLIEQRLGAGGMGAVYAARQTAMDRKVALKVLSPVLSGSDAATRRFVREMQASARVEHQNTIRVYDFGEADGGRLFLAMELLDGRTLTSAIRQAGALPTQRIVHIGSQIARALGAAHAEGIVHRDLKPDNVMLLDRYGEADFVKVLDFGIARFAEGDPDHPRTQLTDTGSLLGTPLYMSPEQSMGHPVDLRTDLYALGVVLYQMATGQVPFSDPTPVRVLFMHVQDPPRPPSQLARVHPGLEAVILRLLSKSPQDRYQTAAEVVQALAACADTVHDRDRQTAEVPGPRSAVTVDEAIDLSADTAMGLPTPVLDRVAPVPPPSPAPVPAVVTPPAAVDPPDRPRPPQQPRQPQPPQQSRQPPPPVAAPTPKSRPVAHLVVPAVVAAALIAGLAFVLWPAAEAPVATQKSPTPPPAVASPPSGLPLPAQRPTVPPARNDLLAAHGKHSEPMAPQACWAQDDATVAILAQALVKLAGGRPGSQRQADTEALSLLDTANATQGGAERLVVLARAYLFTGRHAEALQAARQATEACPDFAVAQHLLGTALVLAGDTAAGEAAFRKATDLAPLFTAPKYNLGLLALAKKDGATALATFQTLAAYEPGKADVHLGLGHALALQGQPAQAQEAWCKAKALGHPEAAKYCP